MRIVRVMVAVGSFSLLTAIASAAQSGQQTNVIQPLPQDLEIQLALSALPAHLRDGATVYILNPQKGFEVGRKGTNGFHAFVVRTGPGAFRASWPFTQYRDDILAPIAFDSAGVNAHMQMFFDVAAMQAEGMAPAELKRMINKRYETGYYRAPERAGVSYMLSPLFRVYENPAESDTVTTMNYPHYMFYAPYVSNQDIGGELMGPHPFIIDPGPHGFIIQGVGEAEKAAINKAYEVMLARLCQLRKVYCLPE